LEELNDLNKGITTPLYSGQFGRFWPEELNDLNNGITTRPATNRLLWPVSRPEELNDLNKGITTANFPSTRSAFTALLKN